MNSRSIKRRILPSCFLTWGGMSLLVILVTLFVNSAVLADITYSDTGDPNPIPTENVVTGEEGVGNVTFSIANQGAYNAVMSGSGTVTKTGDGTLSLSGANTYTGATAINAGSVKLTNSSTMGTGTATAASGTTVEIATAPDAVWNWGGGTINGDGTLKVTGGGNFTIQPSEMQISASGKLIVDGTDVVINNALPDANGDYSGADIFINNGGSVMFSRSGSRDQFWVSTQTTITFDNNGGGTFIAGDNHGLNLVNNSPTKFVTSGGASNYITGGNGFNLHSQDITFDVAKGTDPSGNDLIVSARLWNNKGVIKNGAGSMVITSDGNYSNSYVGNTVVNAGTLKVVGAGALSSGDGAISVARGATLEIDCNSSTTFPNISFEPGSNFNVMSSVAISPNASLENVGLKIGPAGSLTKTDGSEWNIVIPAGQTFTKGLSTFTNAERDMTLTGVDLGGNSKLILSGGTLVLAVADTGSELPVTTGLAARYDASNPASVQTDGSGNVTAWLDSSGNNNHASIATGSNNQGEIKPVKVSETGLNDNTTLDFDNGGNSYFNLNSRITGIRSVFWVLKDDVSPREPFVLGDTDAYHFHRGPNGILWDSGWCAAANGVTIIDGQTVNGTQTVLNKNWQLISVVANNDLQANSIAADRNNQYGARSWTGEMGEILIYTQPLTNSQVFDVSAYLMNKWGFFNSSSTAIDVVEDSVIDASALSSVVLGTVSIADEKSLTIKIADNQPTSWKAPIVGNGGLTISGSGSFDIAHENLQISADGSIVIDGADVILDKKTDTDYRSYISGASVSINNGGSFSLKRTAPSGEFWFSAATTFTFGESGGGTFDTGSQGVNVVNNSDTTFVTTGGAANYIIGSDGFNLHDHDITFDVASGTDQNGNDLVISGRLWNTKGVVKKGAGTLVLTGNNPYNGGTAINAGTVKLSEAGTLGAGGISIAEGAALAFAADLTQTTIPNDISGAGKIVNQLEGTVYLNGANTFTGDMAIESGAVSVLMNDVNKNLYVKNLSGSGDLELRLAYGNNDTTLPNLTNNGFTGNISLVQEGNASGNKINTSGKSFEGFTFKVNPGTSIFVAGGEFKAKVLLSGTGNGEGRGALRIAGPVSGNIIVMTDSTFGFDGAQTISSSIVSGAESGEVTLQLKPYDASNAYGTLTGSIADGDAGSILGLQVVNGTQHVLSGNLSYTGATTIDAGKGLALAGEGANLSQSRAVAVNGTLDFSSYTGDKPMQFNNLTGINGVIAGTDKDLVLNIEQDSFYQGKINVGTGTITKKGEGNLKLLGAYGNLSASNFVIDAGRLDIKEYFTGRIDVTDSAILSPGNSIGPLNVQGDFTLDGGTLLMEVGGPTAADSDQLFISGNLTLNDGSTILLDFINGMAPNAEFEVILDAANSENLDVLSFVDSYYFSNLSYGLNADNYWVISGKIDPNAVPEPSTWALLILGAAGLLYWRKRK